MPQTDFKRALVTGGAGFIGSHVAKRLLSLGVEVVIVDDLSMGTESNVPNGARFLAGSILDGLLVRKALEGVDVVFHNAARVSIRNSFDDVQNDAEVNILGTVNLLKEAGRAGVRKFIYASSMAVYGPGAKPPIVEDSQVLPISPYGVSKLAGEMYVKWLSAFYGYDWLTLRYFNTFGPGQTLTPYVGVITIFINRLLSGMPPVIFGDGGQVRDFVHVEDVAEANVLAMLSKASGAAFNIGTGIGTNVKGIARLLIEKTNPALAPVYAAPPAGEPGDSVADIRMATEILGYSPKWSLEDRIDEVIEWNRAILARSFGGGA